MSEKENQPNPASDEQENLPNDLNPPQEENEGKEAEQAESKTIEKPARHGSGLGALALLVALLAVAAAAALWFNLRDAHRLQAETDSKLQAAIEALQSQQQQQNSSLANGAEQLAGRMQSLEQGMQNLRDQLGQDRIDWLVAESDYLLRYASRRLLLERDVRSALIAMHSADQLLAEGANPLYLPVREKLNDEIQALEALPRVDVDGIALELGAISRQADKLPLATARRAIAKYQAKDEQAAEQTSSSWLGRLFSAMWHEVKSLVTVHRLNQKIQPMLPPEERYFLIQNLRLRLENARLALLRGDNTLYQDDLQVAAKWLQEYFDGDDAAVKNSLASVERLAQINIAPALPQTGEAQRLLEHIRLKNMGKSGGNTP